MPYPQARGHSRPQGKARLGSFGKPNVTLQTTTPRWASSTTAPPFRFGGNRIAHSGEPQSRSQRQTQRPRCSSPWDSRCRLQRRFLSSSYVGSDDWLCLLAIDLGHLRLTARTMERIEHGSKVTEPAPLGGRITRWHSLERCPFCANFLTAPCRFERGEVCEFCGFSEVSPEGPGGGPPVTSRQPPRSTPLRLRLRSLAEVRLKT